ncbi:MAG: hypothetical protein A2428_04490 [Bdellovibrionales bacterium RIFOXYC1_FULL_54_43]|nr:MAG: hypothetical protein A2428_04490 [Bdellovibrionales bacterium RIFOXYC1_FULL_54_43]OFZ83593.1 MAG: hypothetical protein A2603_00470 [Bdellovibrionales bacterium RIFOXYD1_FULL_55_31]
MHLRLFLTALLIFWSLGGLFGPLESVLASDFHSPRTAALGGAGHAGPMLNDTIYLNPSYAAFSPTYSIGGNYQWFNGPSAGPDQESPYRGHLWNLSIQDGRSALFQAGVGLTQSSNFRMIHVGAAKSVVRRIGLGIGGKFVFPNDTRKMIQDGMVSVSGIVSDWLQVVGIVDNMVETPEGRERGLYREFILGTKINVQGIVLLYFDPHWVPHLADGPSYGHETGIEFSLMSDLFLRFGAFRNSNLPFEGLRGRGYGAGIGWIAPKTSFDYGMSRVLSPQPATAHVVGMTLFF